MREHIKWRHGGTTTPEDPTQTRDEFRRAAFGFGAAWLEMAEPNSSRPPFTQRLAFTLPCGRGVVAVVDVAHRYNEDVPKATLPILAYACVLACKD